MTRRGKIGLGFIIGGLALTGIGVGVAVSRKRKKNLGEIPVIGRTKKDGMTLTHRRAAKMPIEKRAAALQDLVWQGVQDPSMRKLALEITNGCPARDGLCEAKAIDTWMRKNIRYTGDVAPIKMGSKGPVESIDLYQSPRRTVEFGGGDCLPIETLVLRDDYEIVPLIELDPGDRIMGENDWTMVQERWVTGEKDILAFELSNGGVLRVTAEHRIFRDVNGRVEEIRAGEARVGDDLIVAANVPFAERVIDWPSVLMALDPVDRVWLLGVYVADGWVDGKTNRDGIHHPYRSAISGRDGRPKEEQKRRVQALMEKIGVPTRWHEKYIALNDSSLARFFATAGGRAYEKVLPSLACTSEDEARALLLGLAADADRRDGVFGTTSPTLALQLRVLHRMLGQSVGIRRVDNHGGFGQHPIYRVTPRDPATERRDVRFARIRSIREDGVALCADISTDSGKFWLPESDILVHNCDDHSVLSATLLALNGITSKFRITSPTLFGQNWSHIYVVAGLPKEHPTQWIALDSTLPPSMCQGECFGHEVGFAKNRDFELKYVKEVPT